MSDFGSALKNFGSQFVSSAKNSLSSIGSTLSSAGAVAQQKMNGTYLPESAAESRDTSAYWNSVGGKLNSALGLYPNGTTPSGTVVSSGSSGSGYSAGSEDYAALPAQQLEYLNADLAKYYGMSSETAYQEALSNTSYQRAVKDMQAAGLNPAVLFGSGRVSGADGVYSANSMVSSSGGSSSRSGSSGSSQAFSKDAYSLIGNISGLIGAAASGSMAGYYSGKTVAQSLMSLVNASKKK